ncbi:hypothetical protein Tco_1411915, partial [Tanacetum coccineum]
VNKVQVMGTLDGRLLKSYRYKDLRALYFAYIVMCDIFLFLKFEHLPPEQSYSAIGPFEGVTFWFQSQGYSEQGIPLVNAGELPEMDPYEEVTQQGQAHPLSPAYVLDPMELDEHVPVYVLEPEHPEYHAPSDDDIQVEDQPYADDASPTAESPRHIADLESMEEDSIDYPDEPEDDDEDPEENPEEDHTNYPADGEDVNDKPSNDDDNDDDTDDKNEEPTKDREGDEHLALADSSAVPVVDYVPSA